MHKQAAQETPEAQRSRTSDTGNQNFSMFKLEQAIHAMRRKGAAGQDGIPPSFLKELGPYRKEELLRIYNISFNTAK